MDVASNRNSPSKTTAAFAKVPLAILFASP